MKKIGIAAGAIAAAAILGLTIRHRIVKTSGGDWERGKNSYHHHLRQNNERNI